MNAFPLEIVYKDTGEIAIVENQYEIESGRAFFIVRARAVNPFDEVKMNNVILMIIGAALLLWVWSTI